MGRRARVLALACTLALCPFLAQAQRQMPDPPTPASASGGKQQVWIQSRDFEELQDLQLTAKGKKLSAKITVGLLSKNRGDYGKGIGVKLWADTNGDGEFSEQELVCDDTQFASQADGENTLTFSGERTLYAAESFSDTTLVRAILVYGEDPQPSGTFDFGDVVDCSYPVLVRQPAVVPLLQPGPKVSAAAFDVSERSPGRIGESIALVSPKGTAISLTRTRIEVRRGDIKLGRPHRSGRLMVIPVTRQSSQPSSIRITPVFQIQKKWAGALTLLTNLFDQQVTVGRVGGERVQVTRVGQVALIRAGEGRQVATLRLTESAPGQLRDVLFLVSPKGTAISLTRTRVEVRRGDVQLGTPQQGGAPNVMVVPVQSPSTTPSEVDISLGLVVAPSAPAAIRIGTSLSRLRLLVAMLLKDQREGRRNAPPQPPQASRGASAPGRLIAETFQDVQRLREALLRAIEQARQLRGR